MVSYSVNNSPPLVSVLGQINLVNLPHLIIFCFSTIFSCTPRSSEGFHSHQFPHKSSVCISFLRHTCLMPQSTSFSLIRSAVSAQKCLLFSSKNLHGSSDNEVLVGFLNCQLFDLCIYLLTRLLFATRQYIHKRHVVIISAVGEGCPAGGQQDGTDAV